MREFLAALADIAIAVFAITSMLSVGLGNRLQDVIGPLHRTRVVGRILLANYVLVPALVLLVVWLLPLDRQLEYGLVLVSLGAGAPFLIKLSTTAGGNLAITATMLVLLLPATILIMPLAVPLLLPGARVSTVAVGTPLVLTMLLPLAMGLLVREGWPQLAARARPLMTHASTIALLVVVLATIMVHFDAIVGVGWWAVLAALITVLGAFTIGYLLGGIDPDNREVISLGTGQRNIAAATVIASQSINETETVVMVIVTSLIGLAVLFPIARLLWRRELARHPQQH